MNLSIPRHPAVQWTVRILYWLLPIAVFCYFYRYSFRTWFMQDDFAWLGLNLSIHSWADLWRTMTQPMAQGTLRILSERALFMSLTKLFGLEILPFRIVMFLTSAGILVLLSDLTRRLSGDRLAGFLAPLLWLANSNLAVTLSWVSAYNQLMCGFTMLAALWFRVRGRRVWEWIFFLIGFGALELNVVYPAIAATHRLCSAPAGKRRRELLAVAPMFGLAIIYAILHRLRAAPDPSGVYRLYFDLQIPKTLWTYWMWAIGPGRYAITHPVPEWQMTIGTCLVTAGLVAFSTVHLRRRDWVALLFPAWFFLILAPLVPLREHITEYYLTMPAIGLAGWGAWACAEGFRAGYSKKGIALGCVLVYLLSSVPVARTASRWWYERGRRVRGLVLGVGRAHELHPAKAILLTGIDDALFWAAVYDRPFRLLGIPEVYLAPGSEPLIRRLPSNGLGEYTLPAVIAKRLLDREQAVVYDASQERLKNVTTAYRDGVSRTWPDDLPRYLDAGNRWYEDQLGPGWHPAEDGYRWMARSATVRLGPPQSGHERLYVTGYVPADVLVNGPVPITVKVNDRVVGETTVQQAGRFDLACPLDPSWVGKDPVEVTILAGKSYRPPGDGRELGLAFGEFAIR